MIDKDSIVTFDLSIQKKDKENYFIGNKIVNNYCEVPEIAITVLKLFDGKRTIGEVGDLIKEQNGVDIDILDFVKNLDELDLILSVNGEMIGPKNQTGYSSRLRKLAGYFFEGKRVYIYFLLIMGSYFALAFNDELPIYDDAILFKQFTGISILIFFIISWSITIIHEVGHYVSSIFLDIPTSFKLKLRYFMLVVEGDINGVWAVEQNKRYICYLGGICFESVLLVITVISKCMIGNNFIVQICNMIILIISLNYIRQFMLFLRTDLYFIILNFLNINGIFMYIKELLFARKIEMWNDMERKEKYSLICFMLISIIGMVFTGIYYLFFINIYYEYVLSAINEMKLDNAIYVFDGACTLIVMIGTMILWIIGFNRMIKEWRKDR